MRILLISQECIFPIFPSEENSERYKKELEEDGEFRVKIGSDCFVGTKIVDNELYLYSEKIEENKMDFALGILAQTIRNEYKEFYKRVDRNSSKLIYRYEFDKVEVVLEVDNNSIFVLVYTKNDTHTLPELISKVLIPSGVALPEKNNMLLSYFELYKEM